jgi:hypothetical protein
MWTLLLSQALANPVTARAEVVQGFQGALVTANAETLQGTQLAGFSVRAETAAGLQTTLGVAKAGDLRGVQLALVAANAEDVHGAQAALGVAVGEDVDLQAALLTWSRGDTALQVSAIGSFAEGTVRGLQASSFATVAAEVRGLQGSGGVAAAGLVRGVQAAPVTVAGEVRGGQAGVINVARRVEGAQVGLINVAREVRGESFGLLSLIGDGIHVVELGSGSDAAALASARLGSRHFYTLYEAGLVHPEAGQWTAGVGAGWQVEAPGGDVATDLTASMVAERASVFRGVALRAASRYTLDLGRGLGVYGGLSAHGWVGDGQVRPRIDGPSHDEGPYVTVWPGVRAGLSFDLAPAGWARRR